MSTLSTAAIRRRIEELMCEMKDSRVAHADRAVFAVAFLGHVLREIPEEHIPKVMKMTIIDLFAARHGSALSAVLEECADELVEQLAARIEGIKCATDPGHSKVVRFRPRVVH